MFRQSTVLFIALLFAGLCAAPAARALDLPGGIGKKKEKKKDEKKSEPAAEKKEAPAAEEKQEEPAAQPAAEEKKAELAAPAAGGEVNEQEVSVNAEAWETYKTFKVGDFVEYGMPANPGMKMRYEVEAVGDKTVTVLTSQAGPGFSNKTRVKYVFQDAASIAKEKLEIAGKTIETTRTDMTSKGKVVSRTWSSKDIPQLMGGMVKSEADGTVSMELTDFGHGK
ncbi:MAG: hypothetical protein M5U26_21505 [Planctomycetota bacterium]|nr:hypothetical protein [Planctomycetota bacterium]